MFRAKALPIFLLLIAVAGAAAGWDRFFKPKEDSTYLVTETEFTKGALVPTGEINRLTRLPEQRRVDAVFIVHLQGVQSGKSYPPLEVKEAHYRNFTIGQVVTRDTVHKAKK